MREIVKRETIRVWCLLGRARAALGVRVEPELSLVGLCERDVGSRKVV